MSTLPPTGCTNATALEIGDVVSGSITNNSTIVAEFPTCGLVTPVTEPAGSWFTFLSGEDARGVRLSTCTDDPSLWGDFDSQMLVFTGSCDRLICLDGNDNEGVTPGCGTEAGVSFRTSPNQMYYVLVYGKQSGATGDFALQASPARVSPHNNVCKLAISLRRRAVGECHPSGCRPSSHLTSHSCQSSLSYDSAGVWFLFESSAETSGEVTITTCSPADSMGRSISVFTGTCDLLECEFVDVVAGILPGNETLACDGIVDAVRFEPKTQLTYFILVQSGSVLSSGTFFPSSGGSATAGPVSSGTLFPSFGGSATAEPTVNDENADFVIQARSASFELAPNDECRAALPLVAGSVWRDPLSLLRAVKIRQVFAAQQWNRARRILWYRYSGSFSSGNQTVLTVTSCTGDFDLDNTAFDQQIIVYAGDDCNSLRCIEGDFGSILDGSCGLKDTVRGKQNRESITTFGSLGTTVRRSGLSG